MIDSEITLISLIWAGNPAMDSKEMNDTNTKMDETLT